MSSSGGSGRINRPGHGVANFFRGLTGRARTHSTAFQRFAGRIQRMRGGHAKSVKKNDLEQLADLLDEAIREAERQAEDIHGHRSFELVRAKNSSKDQMKRLLDSLPADLLEEEELQQLIKKVSRHEEEKSNFARGTMLKGTTRSEVRQGEVKRWVEKVDQELADERGKDAEDEGAEDPEDKKVRRWTFHTAVDEVRRKRKRGEPVEPRDVELVADRAFELMQTLREELSPSWAPEERPRWVSAGDKYVYDLALAAVPKELFQDTNGWQGIQRLRSGEEVFTLRAADNIAEAMKRK